MGVHGGCRAAVWDGLSQHCAGYTCEVQGCSPQVAFREQPGRGEPLGLALLPRELQLVVVQLDVVGETAVCASKEGSSACVYGDAHRRSISSTGSGRTDGQVR